MKASNGAMTILVFMSPLVAAGQSWSPPPDSERCPSKWGAGDERGSANHVTPASVLKAAKLIRTGEIIELGHVLGPNIPGRRFEMVSNRTEPGTKSNKRGGNDEFVATYLGQVGTQLDGFAHQTYGDSMYNCFKNSEIMTRQGATKLGIENVGTLFSRGVLIDVAALKQVDMLPPGYEITVADLEQALAREKVSLQPGDAILINTGHGKLYGKDNERYMKAWPGIGVAAAEWLAAKDPLLVGADNTPVEVFPEPDPQLSGPVHQIFLVINGIHNLEHLKLDELSAKRVYEFAFVIQPLKMKGASGSTVAPVAIR